MGLWVVLAILTALAVLSVLVPLTRSRAAAAGAEASDVAVYRSQLREIDAELARGLLDPREAEAARLEIGRRLLAADRAAQAHSAAVRPLPRGLVAAVIVAVPLLSVGLYLAGGAPGYPDQPLSARLQKPVEDQDYAVLIARVEEHLAANPRDGQGWEVLAPVYMRLGRFEDAARAWHNAIQFSGATAAREANFGEALVALDDGMVSETARAAFERALASEPGNAKARFFLAVAAEQDGDSAGAAAQWRALLADSPPDAPWRGAVAHRLAALEAGADATAAAPGPSAADVAAARAMTAEERARMISDMVAGLAARLAEDGRDLDGWLRLARAYVVLGTPDKARDALASARRNYPDDAEAGARIEAAERELGLGS